jgi:hypothetical protein
MIQQVLPIVIDELNEYLKSQFNAIEDKAVLSNLIDQDGSIAIEGSNKIIASVVLIDRDTTSSIGGSGQFSGNQYTEFSPALNINLTVMFSAYFNKNHYNESLKYISGVIYFFQNKFLFTSQNTPKLGKGVDKLHFDLISLSPQELMNMYSMLGAKYMPSVVYKVRMLTFSQDNIINEMPAITNNKIST